MRGPTEALHPRAARLGPGDVRALQALMLDADLAALASLRPLLPRVARVAGRVARALEGGGRLVYLGAGTSGRLGALDAAECPPTFGVAPGQVVALVAGGRAALWRSVEGAEDDAAAGRAAVRRARVGPGDVAVGISASGGAAWVRAALEAARRAGAFTVFVTCNPAAARRVAAAAKLVLRTGPEVLQGSTRLSAAAATRALLAMISTGAMLRLGRMVQGRMVSLRPTNRKLRARALANLVALSGLPPRRARTLLARAGGDVRRALRMVH